MFLFSSLILFSSCLGDTGIEEYDNSEDIEFLEDNAEREDITVTESGLQYRVIRDGEGDLPGPQSLVSVHYEGTLVSGDKFDSSYDRGEPAEFPVNGVIPGFSEGVQLMNEGAEYELFIPEELGYGRFPPPGTGIHPGATLIFRVELLEILDND